MWEMSAFISQNADMPGSRGHSVHLFIPGWGNIDLENQWRVTDTGIDLALAGAKLYKKTTKGKGIP